MLVSLHLPCFTHREWFNLVRGFCIGPTDLICTQRASVKEGRGTRVRHAAIPGKDVLGK